VIFATVADANSFSEAAQRHFMKRRYKRIVARTITPATPQITTIANRKCMATPPLPKDHRDGDRRDYTPHETHRYYRVHSEPILD
jgi:hypothetical protein